MKKYYTRACNFYYGKSSELKIKKKISLPLNGNNQISFDCIELITRKTNKIFNINKIKNLPKEIKSKVYFDLNNITKKKIFSKLNFSNKPLLMGVLNVTPDSFSDGGNYLKNNLAKKHIKKLIKEGTNLIDIGGESTRPGSKSVDSKIEWKRLKPKINFLSKQNFFISLDTRKSFIMNKSLKYGINLINDVSGISYDAETINFLKKTNIPFVIHHMKGNPEIMQKKTKYKNVLLDIYDFFEERLDYIRSNNINHNNIILDPGIGFGKNLKHNITLINKISLFHSLGFPIMLGLSRKRFIKDIATKNDSKNRIGGTLSSSIYSAMQGVQILRVHDVNEIKQGLDVFYKLKYE